jgi:hypothetical protein
MRQQNPPQRIELPASKADRMMDGAAWPDVRAHPAMPFARRCFLSATMPNEVVRRAGNHARCEISGRPAQRAAQSITLWVEAVSPSTSQLADRPPEEPRRTGPDLSRLKIGADRLAKAGVNGVKFTARRSQPG